MISLILKTALGIGLYDPKIHCNQSMLDICLTGILLSRLAQKMHILLIFKSFRIPENVLCLDKGPACKI